MVVLHCHNISKGNVGGIELLLLLLLLLLLVVDFDRLKGSQYKSVLFKCCLK